MSDDELQERVDSWIAYWEDDDATRKTQYDPETEIALLKPTDIVRYLRFDGDHELLVAAYKRDLSERLFGLLPAGELEDLIADFREIYIDSIEKLSRKDPKFRRLLGGVWRNASKSEIWQRIVQARAETW